jgi:hypothetical protein
MTVDTRLVLCLVVVWWGWGGGRSVGLLSVGWLLFALMRWCCCLRVGSWQLAVVVHPSHQTDLSLTLDLDERFPRFCIVLTRHPVVNS